jgi:hypothetical protein
MVQPSCLCSGSFAQFIGFVGLASLFVSFWTLPSYSCSLMGVFPPLTFDVCPDKTIVVVCQAENAKLLLRSLRVPGHGESYNGMLRIIAGRRTKDSKCVGFVWQRNPPRCLPLRASFVRGGEAPIGMRWHA